MTKHYLEIDKPKKTLTLCNVITTILLQLT